jgi:hypothetical protein
MPTLFSMSDDLCYCNDIPALLQQFHIEYEETEWRLFIDASIFSIKAVLLHHGNSYPLVPVAYCVSLRENYENIKKVLQCICYDENNWDICADLNVVAILTGLHLGYTKHYCYICLWDSRDRANHYTRRNWPLRTVSVPGTSNVIHHSLIDRRQITLPVLPIKLGLMKKPVKAFEKESAAFPYLRQKFPSLSVAKIKEEIFIGLKIRDVLQDDQYEQTMNPLQLVVWKDFRAVCIIVFTPITFKQHNHWNLSVRL